MTELNLNECSGKAVLKDGSTIVFRPIRKEDIAIWLDFYLRLKAGAGSFKLHNLPDGMNMEGAQSYCTVDGANQFALAAEVRENRQKRIVGAVRYHRLEDPQTAEISLAVLDSYQGQELGSQLIERLASAARKQDIRTFMAQVPAQNTALLATFWNTGFPLQLAQENGFYRITFPLAETPQTIEKKDERDSQAAQASLKRVLKPRSLALIGASNRTGAIGNLILKSMLESGFKGPIYPINANYDTVMSLKAYPSVLNVPGEIDLAIFAAPSAQILNIMDECGRKKVKGIIIVADGFREKDAQGEALEREMAETAFGYGMRIFGPNCAGVINNDPEVRLKATFDLIKPLPGNISFISQSGALGFGILEHANSLGVGIANFISVGNRADIASTDLLQYWEKDPATNVIVMYLESFDSPETFRRTARRVSRQKPILAIKGGSTPEGSRATRSHTGAIATSSVVSEAFLRETGIVQVKSVSELLDSAILLANQPVPKGRNVAVVSSGGGPGILTADACIRQGLKLPEIPAETLAKIKSVIKRDLNIHNPVDLTASVGAEEFARVLKIVAEDPAFDAIITIYVPPSGPDIAEFERAILGASPAVRQNNKPLLACYVGMTTLKGKTAEGHFVPYYLFPDEAAAALANAEKYYELKTAETGSVPEFPDMQREKAREVVRRTGNGDKPTWMAGPDMNELFQYYGIKFAESVIAVTAEEAAVCAERVGFPVVIKLNSTTITHKTDVGGVILNMKTPEEVRQAFKTIKNNLAKAGREKEMQGVTVQRQIAEGLEVIVGVTRDNVLGHAVMFGMGGVTAEMMQDTAVRMHPLTDVTAKELINSVKISRLLQGYRGATPYDVRALEDLLLRVSAMIEDNPQIAEIDLNPVKVQGEGYWVVDGRVGINCTIK